MTHVEIRLTHGDKEYVLHEDHPDSSTAEGLEFYYTDGNGACDCNLSLEIQRKVDPTFPELPCGDKGLKMTALIIDGTNYIR